jgi:hypothetical protein
MANNINSKIVFAEKSFDIGCPVILWNEPGGLNFYSTRKFSPRNVEFNSLNLTQFAIHWSATYKALHTFNGLKSRGLSCTFIIDDNDINGYATIYQALDGKEIGWSQGQGFNQLGPGVEISYIPTAWSDPNAYSDAIKQKWNVPNHTTTTAWVHGTKLKVFLPTEAQLNSLYSLIWGFSELFPKIPMKFPTDNNGNYITTALTNPEKYIGLVNHFHLTKGKIDTAGLDMRKVEEEVVNRKLIGY